MFCKLPLALASGHDCRQAKALAELLFLIFPLGFSLISDKAKRIIDSFRDSAKAKLTTS